MIKKNDEQKINELEEKIKKYEMQKKELQARLKAKERKERTRNLIESGAILQSISLELFNNKMDVELFKKFVTETKYGKELLEHFANYRQDILITECEEMSKTTEKKDLL